MAAQKLLCVAYDTTPSRALRMLVAHAADNRLSTDFVLLDGGSLAPPGQLGLEEKVKNADIVVIGMSSAQNAGIETEAARLCKKHAKRFGFFSDTHGAYRREQFREFWTSASFVLVVCEDDEVGAAFAFPSAKVSAVGNPQWAVYFEPKERDPARAIVQARSGEYVVFAPGTKDPDHNLTVWEATIKAAGLHWENRLVVISRHPGDKTDIERYAHLRRLADEHHVRLVWYDGPGDALLPGIDLLINGTSLRVHAFAQLIPVIDYYERQSQDWLEKDIGSRFGTFYGSGAVIDVYDESWVDLAAAMLVIANNPLMLRANQSTAVKRMTASESLDAMLAAVSAPVHA